MNSLLPVLITIFLTSLQSSDAACNKTNPCPLQGGRPLPRCPEVVSKHGYLEIVLSVEIGIFKFDWLELPRRSYNGSKCPVTWRVKPGDTVRVKLINNLILDDPSDVQNLTNLHLHGLHISSKEPQDNVFVSIKPGESYQYTFQIIDDHPPGTYWYHAHHHGSVTLQTTGGLAGMLIIEDDPKKTPTELRAVSCPENCEHDISLLVSSTTLMRWAIFHQMRNHDSLRDNLTRINEDETLEDWLNKNVYNFTVNGEINPIITLQQDQLTRFRILNVGDVPPLELSVVDEFGNPAPCDIREIARDGIYFDAPAIPKHGQSVIFPGNRLDWLIKCKEMGAYKLFSHAKEIHNKAFSFGFRSNWVIATIQVTERANIKFSSTSFPELLPRRPEYLKDTTDEQPNQIITVEISGNSNLNREYFSRPDHFRYKVKVDSVIEIHMLSSDYDFSHPMHFHMNHVQVIGYQPYTGPVAYYQFLHPVWEMRDQKTGKLCDYQHPKYKKGELPFNITDPLIYKGQYARWKKDEDALPYHSPGEWLDTVYVPALSNLTLRMRTDRFTGTMLVHCHVPLDSDLGMMMVIEVVEKGGNLSGASIISGNAAPGSCRKCDWNRYQDIPPECTSDISGFGARFSMYVAFASAVILLAVAAAQMKLSRG